MMMDGRQSELADERKSKLWSQERLDYFVQSVLAAQEAECRKLGMISCAESRVKGSEQSLFGRVD